MQAAAGSNVVAGVALAGAGFIAVSPVAAPPEIHSVTAAVRLVSTAVADSADSIANIPQNLFTDIANIPYNLFEAPYDLPAYTGLPASEGAIGELTDALNYAGNWFLYSPTNIWGWDPGDPGKLEALVNVLTPFPAYSESLGQQLNTAAEAELPMSAECPLDCPNIIPILTETMQVSLPQLTSGYTLPVSIDPYDNEPVAWSGTTVTLDPSAPLNNFIASLEADPSTNPIEPMPSLSTIDTSILNLDEAAANAFNMDVPGSFLMGGPGYGDPGAAGTALADLTGALGANVATDLSALLSNVMSF